MDSTLLKGLDILERIVQAGAPVSLSDLARETGLPKSNVHRTLSALTAAGYVAHDSRSRRYVASLKLAVLGQRVTARTQYRAALLPHMQSLAETTQETVSFALPSGQGIAVIANAVPARSLAAILPEHRTFEMNDTALGLALAADAPRDPVVGAYGLIPSHPQRQTFELALPLSTDGGTALGAIGIVAPASRYSDARVAPMLSALSALRQQLVEGHAPDAGSLAEGAA